MSPQRFVFRIAVVAAVLAAGLGLTGQSGVWAQTAADVEQRDQLIADQEALLNVYRCMFGVDVEVVPGGCANPDTIAPGPAPANPTQTDIDVRDGLIQSQEALLNTYRCQFDIDTQLVPGECQSDGAETEASGAGSTEVKIAVSAGGSHSCGIKQNGAAVCWGLDDVGQSDAPQGVLTAVSAGYRHSCGIMQSGAAVCWGLDDVGRLDAPQGVFTAVSAGGSHSCGIRVGGTIVCWGWNNDGQSNAPQGVFTAVSAGGSHSCGIRVSGTIACWGDNSSGLLDPPQGVFTAVSAGGGHSCGIRVSGTIACWGSNYGGPSWPSNRGGPLDAPQGVFTAVSAGGNTSCGIKQNGAAVCWGYNFYGQSDAPQGVFTAISAGGNHSCGIKQNGAAVCWGSYEFGQSDAPQGGPPQPIPPNDYFWAYQSWFDFLDDCGAAIFTCDSEADTQTLLQGLMELHQCEINPNGLRCVGYGHFAWNRLISSRSCPEDWYLSFIFNAQLCYHSSYLDRYGGPVRQYIYAT